MGPDFVVLWKLLSHFQVKDIFNYMYRCSAMAMRTHNSNFSLFWRLMMPLVIGEWLKIASTPKWRETNETNFKNFPFVRADESMNTLMVNKRNLILLWRLFGHVLMYRQILKIETTRLLAHVFRVWCWAMHS